MGGGGGVAWRRWKTSGPRSPFLGCGTGATSTTRSAPRTRSTRNTFTGQPIATTRTRPSNSSASSAIHCAKSALPPTLKRATWYAIVPSTNTMHARHTHAQPISTPATALPLSLVVLLLATHNIVYEPGVHMRYTHFAMHRTCMPCLALCSAQCTERYVDWCGGGGADSRHGDVLQALYGDCTEERTIGSIAL